MTGLVHHYGLAALFLIGMLESGGIPLPGETALIAAALFASNGNLDITEVIAVAAAAAIIGDNLGYWIGRTGGRGFLPRRAGTPRHAAVGGGLLRATWAEDDLHRTLLLDPARDRGLDGGCLAHALVDVLLLER